MSKGDKSDLTLLDDLEKFEHHEDPEVDLLLTPKGPEAISPEELPPETPFEIPENEVEDTAEPISEEVIEENDLEFTTTQSHPLEDHEKKNDLTQEIKEQEQQHQTETPSFNNELPFVDETPNESADEIHDKTHDKTIEEPRYQPENFKDVNTFAQNISYGQVKAGGNPPFSVMLKNIRFKEDAEEILSILEEHGLLTADSEKDIRQGIFHGAVLISQISEYSAIYLAHKLRRFDMDILLGLSEELHHSKNYENESTSPINKENIHQNHSENLDLTSSPITFENIIISTTPSLEGYRINRYIEILTEHALLDEDEFASVGNAIEKTQIYDELIKRLKNTAYRLRCNAVLGVNFQFIPLVSSHAQARYKIICTGNAVILSNQ